MSSGSGVLAPIAGHGDSRFEAVRAASQTLFTALAEDGAAVAVDGYEVVDPVGTHGWGVTALPAGRGNGDVSPAINCA
jgi:hypothetical protein